ncbi:MAG: Mut7-C ubiquitin/RNAse domain-containing protein [Betaproteobacteria bacterium]|nr:Mut7-C ubiquitin/RNAse domain-containing protein [Betaproteobacteria bacterium]
MPRETCEFRFYEELNDFLPAEWRRRSVAIEIDRGRSVKDAIESAGVPHPEVDLVLVDGASVGFDHVLHGGERVAVYPVFERLDISPLVHLRPAPLRNPRFVLDSHLGKLARHLRMAGFDALWDKDYADEQIVSLALAERRIILTRDKGLLKRRAVERGYFVRSIYSEIQLAEVVGALQLERLLRPFSRCRECNVELADAPKAAVLERLPEKVREHYERFKLCSACGRVYWEGTHYARMRRVIARVMGPV